MIVNGRGPIWLLTLTKCVSSKPPNNRMQPTALRALPAGRLFGLVVLPAGFQADSRAAADARR